MEIPVYLFTGFLESGKTTFIMDALSGSEFNSGERTLMLLCEEGETEYDVDTLRKGNVFVEVVESKDDLTSDNLAALQQKHEAERVIIEYNGMWMIEDLFANMPKNWIVYQEVTFADANSFITYNKNMRQLVFDKLKTAELVVFNRCEKGFDKMPFHEIVRVANRKNQIIYEYGPFDAEPDMIQDPLPFDLDAPVIHIGEDAFAEWYRDINEEEEKYGGKTLKVKGRAALGGGVPSDGFVFGRHIMTCCADDIQFGGLLCKWKDSKKLAHGGWVEITAKVKIEYAEIYRGRGPVLYCRKVIKTKAADPEVATF